MQSSYRFRPESAVFDEPNLVSAAGLVPVLELAEQTGLSELIGQHVDLPSTRVKSGAVNPVGKLTSIIGPTSTIPAPPDPADQTPVHPAIPGPTQEPHNKEKAGTGQPITHAPARHTRPQSSTTTPTTTRNHPSTESGLA